MSLSGKPLGIKAYGSIGHLPESRLGPGDHKVNDGQARIATEKARDHHDNVTVTIKMDGSCVAVARIGGVLIPLGRAGWPAASSPFEQHRLFHVWVMRNQDRFMAALGDGERMVGEWLAQAHGTRYELAHEPFCPFDVIIGQSRIPYIEMREKALVAGLVCPALIHSGGPISVKVIKQRLAVPMHGELDPVEGAVWRVERKGKCDFLAKWVRPDKKDGCYLPEISANNAIWNWRPQSEKTA
jgi:hypothetical protein